VPKVRNERRSLRERPEPIVCLVSQADRQHWDRRYADRGMASFDENGPLPPPAFAHVEHLFPTEGAALEVACGRGRGAVWIASRGMDYWGVDVSAVGIDLARKLTSLYGVADRCRFDVVDLDEGLPAGPPVDLLFCHLFRDPRLDRAMTERLAPGGLLAVAVLSEVGVGPGEFRARPGELRDAFESLEIVDEGEGEGMARILARRPLKRPA
jgi:SAM-dependent methyltransferase